ncbi:ABC transporter permease [Streptomyces sp. NBC_00536]|uniref:ABC transporter permease n=1 Tax=Streptomyces sp. NBC_00536 TaxID=2975769 RepID=UPI002E81E18E|nr:ABC transporter permease [Streptomyces sp. NBC_00536]WUC83116.1 ABC transporter permease [Streptomyces sp. NBC_00536]
MTLLPMTLLPIALATLRRRWTGLLGSFVALALGVGLISATGILLGGDLAANADPAGPSLNKLLQFMAGMAGFVSVFVVAGTFAFAVAQRRRETALLRAIGATPRQVRALVLGEAVLVALVAAAAGCLLGLAMAPGIAAWLVRQGAAPAGFTGRVSATSLVVAVLIGLVVALIGAFTASRRAGRVRPVEALGEAAADRRGMTWGRWLCVPLLLVVAGSSLTVFLTPQAATLRDPGMRGSNALATGTLLLDVLAVVTVVLFAPLLIPLLVRLFTLPAALAPGATGLLARQNALGAVRRTVSTATPVLLVIGLAGSVAGGAAAFSQARTAQVRTALAAHYVVQLSAKPEQAVRTERAEQAVLALRALGVVTTTTTLVEDLDTDTAKAAQGQAQGEGEAQDNPPLPTVAMAVDGDLATAWRLPADAGSLADLTGATVAVSTDMARGYGWHVGDRLTTRLADGSTTGFRLVAIVRTPPNLAEVLLPYAAVAGHLGDAKPPTGYAATRPAAVPGATVASADAWLDAWNADHSHFDWITILAIMGPALLYALIALVNTMLMSTSERLRDFGALRLTGGTRPQVLIMVALEAVLVVATAATLGLLLTVATQWGTVTLIHDRLPTAGPTPLALPWTVLATSAAICLVLAVLAAAIPARLALRTRALDMAGIRE